jgi:aspartate aminotransferase-like enzyme
VANFVCGAFSQRQADITKICGLDQDIFYVEWGQATTAEQVDSALSQGNYDLVTVVFNETSTGVMNPLAEIGEVVKNYPDVLLMVDAVSGMAGAPIKVDEWGIDMALASVQKAWGLPPGFAVTSLSDAALERSRSIPESQKGFYFDFVRMHKAGEKSQTTITPGIPHLYALSTQLDRIKQEGLENRFARHTAMANRVREWGAEKFGLFPQAGYESDTLTCFNNKLGIDLIALAGKMKERNYLISGGYGDLKGKTFRLAHMGNLQMDDINDVLNVLDEVLGEL